MKIKVLHLLIAAFMFIALTASCTSESNPDTSSNELSSAANSATPTLEVTAEGSSVSSIDVSGVKEKLKTEDSDSSWDVASSTQIVLMGDSADISGSGAVAEGAVVTITNAGTYIVSGTLSKGQILINADKKDTVRLVLNGADITSDSNAAIYAASADKLIITLAEGTLNTVTDAGATFVYADTESEEPDAAVFSKCDLTLNGTGALTVNAGFYNGIGTKDDLVIAGGDYTVIAAKNGIRGRDSLTVLGGVFDVTAGNDGFQSNNNEDPTKGWIYLEDGVFTIAANHDAVQSETDLTIADGIYTLISSIAVSETSDSFKGFKAGGNISIGSGYFCIDSADDCIHANGSIFISGGDFELSSDDDGIHADADVSISGGTILVQKSFEGIEGANVAISGGVITITASDDGINAAGGNDDGMGGRFGRDQFMQSGNYSINVSGGEVSLTAGGDGFDSNGTISLSGGIIISLINSTADNGAMDCDGAFSVSGGTIIYGGTGIGQISNTVQSYIFTDLGFPAGTEVTLKKEQNVILSFIPSIDCSYLVMSTPDIETGEEYTVNVGTNAPVSVTAGTGGYMGGMGRPGGGQGGFQFSRPEGGQDGFQFDRPEGGQDGFQFDRPEGG